MKNNKEKLFKILAAVVGVAVLVSVISFSACNSDTEQGSSTDSVTSVSEDSDKTAPVITLAADSVSVELGTDYKISENIKSVKDDVDGEIKNVEKLSKNTSGYIIDDSKVDLKNAGDYQVTVEAQDKSGNVAKKTFKLTVKEKSDKSVSEKKETASVQKSETKTGSKKNEVKKNTATSNSSKNATSSKSSTTSSSGSNQPSTSSSKPVQNTQKSDTSASQPAKPAQHVHNWVHHDATGHYETVVVKEAWDEQTTVQEASTRTYVICNGCGRKFYMNEFAQHQAEISDEEMMNGCGSYGNILSETYYVDVPKNIHHDAVTEQKWIQDSAAYDSCSCGATK